MKNNLEALIKSLVCSVLCPQNMAGKFLKISDEIASGLSAEQVEFCIEQAEAILART
jgi:hypothetical protein